MKGKSLRKWIAGMMAAVMLLSSCPFAFGMVAAAEESGSYFKNVLEVVATTASGNEGGNSKIENITNGSGMSNDTVDATHDAKSGGLNAWSTNQAEGTAVWVQVDFGAAELVGSMYIWNNNHPGHTYRGFKNVKIETSLDGVEWSELRDASQTSNSGSYPYTFKQASGTETKATNLISGEPVKINRLARFVKITADPVAGQGNYWTNQADKNDALSELRFIEMENTTAAQDLVYPSLKKFFGLYEIEYTPATWAEAEDAAKAAIEAFNSGNNAQSAAAALEEAIDHLVASGKLYVRVIPVISAVAGSDAGGNSNVLNVINGSGMSNDGLDATHAKAAGAVGAWHTVGSSNVTGRTDAWIQFDLGKITSVGTMHIWNMNQGDSSRGMKNVKIELSLDGKNWTELRDASQIANSGSYPYELAKAATDNSPASNLTGGAPVKIGKMTRYIKITADPTMANGSYGTEAYGLCEVRFGSMNNVSAAQIRLQAAIDRVAKKSSALYTANSWANYIAQRDNLISLFGKSGLTDGEATNAITAFEAAENALQKIETASFYCDFSNFDGYDPKVESSLYAEMDLSVSAGTLNIKGEQTKDGLGYAYTKVISGLDFKIKENSRLSYIISPKMDRLFNGQYPSQYVAVDLKFSDGTYLSDLGILDDNEIGIHPNEQGSAKAQYMDGTPLDTIAAKYDAKNLIIVRLGQWEKLIGKTVTDILVGYENAQGYDNYIFETSIDEIKLAAETVTYEKPTDYVLTTAGTVNYMINDAALGCYSFGKSAPFVALPHSFNLWAPMNVNATNQLRTIYYYERPYLKGFTCSHQANYHIGDMINWNFAVTNGGSVEDTTFARENEIAKAHYYSVTFDKDSKGRAAGTKAELTTTEHGAALRVTYDQSLTTRGIILKGINDTITGKVSGLSINQSGKSFAAVVDATVNHGVEKMYVYGTFDQAISSYDSTTAYFSADSVTMKVATSFISAEQAKKNYDRELGNKTFMEIYTEAENVWLEKLGAIEIEGGTETQLINFYTHLYRSYLYPNHMGEYTGAGSEGGWQYKGIYGSKAVQDGKLYYNNGFWDNYRTTWPLMTLLDPDSTAEMIEGLLCHYDDNGWIPRWTSAIGMDCMCGTSTDIIFGDALARGLELDADVLQKAYEASVKNATMSTFAGAAGGRDGLDEYIFKGYITDDSTRECALSWALAGYYNDYGIAQIAKEVGDIDTYEYMMNRAVGYVNMFDTKYEWFRGIEEDTKAEWKEDLNPLWYDGDYMESFPYIMAFDAPYDGQGLVNLYGSKAEMEKKLDSVFNTYGDLIWNHEENRYGGATHELYEVAQVKMGVYEHNNQPAHHLPYMYLYTGSPYKTQSTVREVLQRCYVNARCGGGYIGDDDGGEQAAWYVLSALGLYPLNMGSGELAFGSPLFDKATIHLQNGKDIVINAENNSVENVYVESLKINGKAYNKTSIAQSALTENGAVLDFKMTDEPTDWGADSAPASITKGTAVPNPLKDQTKPSVIITDSTANVERATSNAGTNTAKLFDNTATTEATVASANGKASVYYHFDSARTIEMYTISSGSTIASNPGAYALYGSNDGANWKLLDKTDDQPFKWTTETKGFLVDDQGAYTDYRVDLYTTGSVTISEIELMSAEDEAAGGNSGSARERLQLLYDSTASYAEYWYTTDSWNTFATAKNAAKSALDNQSASADALNNSKNTLQAAIDGLAKNLNLQKALTYQVPAGMTVTVDDQTNGAASLAFDGDVTKNKKWCTHANTSSHWLQIDFGSDVLVQTFALWNAGTEAAKFITDSFKVQMKVGENWVDLYSTTGNTTDIVTYDLAAPAVGKSFRLYITDCGADNHARIHEFHLFGQKASSDAASVRANLQKLYDSTANLVEYQYTTNSWNTLVSAKATAKTALDNAGASAADLLGAFSTLQNGVYGLAKSMNYTKSLNYKIDASKLSTNHSEATQTPANAMDGIVDQDASKWCSAQNSDHWLVINFGKKVVVNNWLVHNTGAGTAENRTDYITTNMKLQVLKGSTWVDVDAVSNNTLTVVNRTLSEPVVGEQFRLYVTSPCNTYNQTSGRHVLRIYEYHLFGGEYTAEMASVDEMKAAAAAVDAKIAAIGNVTKNSKTAIDTARAAYNALSEEGKGFVTKGSALRAAETAYAEILAAEKAAEVDAKIAAIGTVSYDSQTAAKINTARNSYDALSDLEKSFVTKLDVLLAAEADYAALAGDQVAKDAAAAVDAKIIAIGAVTLQSKTAIEDARTAYNALSPVAKGYVTQYTRLQDAEAAYAALAAEQEAKDAAAAVDAKIDAIGPLPLIDLKSEAKIEEARAAYDALSNTAKGYVTGIEDLQDAEARLAELKSYASMAGQVEAKIAAIGEVKLGNLKALREAIKAYESLHTNALPYLENEAILFAAIAELESFAEGDANMDGEVNLADLVRLLRYANGKITDNVILLEVLDLTGDGLVDTADASALAKAIL